MYIPERDKPVTTEDLQNYIDFLRERREVDEEILDALQIIIEVAQSRDNTSVQVCD